MLLFFNLVKYILLFISIQFHLFSCCCIMFGFYTYIIRFMFVVVLLGTKNEMALVCPVYFTVTD